MWASAISYSRSCKLVCDSIGLLLDLLQILGPARAVPELDVVLDADDRHVADDAGELEQAAGQLDAPLAVELGRLALADVRRRSMRPLLLISEVLLDLLGDEALPLVGRRSR